ncbi:hypothetical protein DUI87_06875 [Hirundo rustica rustica]|uniref:Uncharacterized protein n=1 Tax=Hirundo rustica rustica TaxID=333673 RepID=A0A3M0KNR7_HIRRU|nr:hypothetical protein DUI87_06875 [Hirundo rustica rustica]
MDDSRDGDFPAKLQRSVWERPESCSGMDLFWINVQLKLVSSDGQGFCASALLSLIPEPSSTGTLGYVERLARVLLLRLADVYMDESHCKSPSGSAYPTPQPEEMRAKISRI